jgi:Zn-dependent peptidase ImmA (M78 family)/transcriptional regulator with XRE-family HTH domain
MFNATRLRIARLFHGMTQRELADRVAVSNGQLAAFESGGKEPKDDVLDALCSVLLVKPAYFGGQADEFREDEANFRRRISAPERLKRQVLARGSLFGMVVEHLSRLGKFPAYNFPTHTIETMADVEVAAEQCRLHWNLTLDAPIGDMARVVENAGVVILAIDLQTAERVDAFSRFGETSVIVLNLQKHSASRTLWDMAHETAHGVLHQHARGVPLEQREAEADRFAGAFLLPRDAFAADFTACRAMGWDGLLDLKRHWRTSVQAILVRARQLELIDAAEYRTRFRTLSGWGWRTSEPDEPTLDMPSLFNKALERAHKDYGTTAADLAETLGWRIELFTSVTGVQPAGPRIDPNIISLTERRLVADKNKAPTS